MEVLGSQMIAQDPCLRVELGPPGYSPTTGQILSITHGKYFCNEQQLVSTAVLPADLLWKASPKRGFGKRKILRLMTFKIPCLICLPSPEI